MNYLRGAVSAISAPYQYYKDINPSTLTGAIDVIVISRPKLVQSEADPHEQTPAPDGEKEYACSPFHVRFGKWQVLRPADKKVRSSYLTVLTHVERYARQVNVFVNGHPIPFSMKIGDAGEAFFVFETDEDIPENIATSPLLEATRPGQSNTTKVQRTGRFGAKDEGEEAVTQNQDAQEPEFLDLDAPASAQDPQADREAEAESTGPGNILARTAAVGKAALGIAHEAEKTGKDKLEDQQVREAMKEVEHEKRSYIKDSISAAKNSTQYIGLGADKGDEALPNVSSQRANAPDVTYGHGAFPTPA